MEITDVDPVTFEVIWHRLLDITEEMGIKYMRTSGSPVLVGAYDASTAITTADGELVAMGPYITTQAHVLRLIVQAVLERRGASPGIDSDDMFICNDPYLGATHQPDVATVAPVHVDGSLRAWVGSSGHWLDIGGSEPGGFNMTARSVFDEGLRMPPTRIVDGGTVREDLVELVMNHLREPLAELDLRGQIVANRAGTTRLRELFAEYGTSTVERVMRAGIDQVEERLRQRLRQLPDGVWREVQYLDHDGHRPNIRCIVCTVTKRGDSLRIDFTGTDPEADGFANCARGGLRAATLSAVCIVLGYDLTWNDGVARCVDIVAPPRTAVTAEFPAPVSMSTISAIIVTLNLVAGALSKLVLASELREEAMGTWCGTSLGVSMMGRNDRGQMTVCAEASHFAAGCGARTYRDGVDTGGIIINTTANIPSIEATEGEYPLLYLFRRQLRDSGGAGQYRGGVSGEVALIPHRAVGHLETSFAGVGAETPNAFGLAGGLPGATVRYLRFAGSSSRARLDAGDPPPSALTEIDGRCVPMPVNHSHADFPPDMVEYHNWQGGGGYGDPLEREAEAVAKDVRADLVSPDVALDTYGVVMADGIVDAAATERRRGEMRAARLREGSPATELLGDALLPSFGDAVAGNTSSGTVRYGDLVEFDFDRDESRCVRCGHRLGAGQDDFRLGCLVAERPAEQIGPVHGDGYAQGEVTVRLFWCPGCARQLEAEVARAGAPRAAFRIASSGR